MSEIGRRNYTVSPAMKPIVGSPTVAGAVELLCEEPFPHKNRVDEAKASTIIIAAAQVDIGLVDGNFIEMFNDVTGMLVERLGTIQEGARRTIRHTGPQGVTLAFDETYLFIQGRRDIVTEPDDLSEWIATGVNQWMMLDYKRASGQPLEPPGPPAPMFIYDVSSPANYTATGTVIDSLVDLSNALHNGVQTVPGFKANVEMAKVNGQPAIKFVNSQHYLSEGLLTEGKNKTRLTYRWDLTVDALPVGNVVLRRVWSSQAAPLPLQSLLTISLLGTNQGVLAGHIRVSLRTGPGQTAASLNSSYPIELAAPTSLLIVDINMQTAQIGFKTDYRPMEYISNFIGGGVVGWPGGARRFENFDSAEPSQYGGNPNDAGTWYINRFEGYTGSFTAVENNNWWLGQQLKFDSPRQTLAIAGPAGFGANKVWQTDGVSSDIPVTVTATAGGDGPVKYELLRASGVRAVNPLYSPTPPGNGPITLSTSMIAAITQANPGKITFTAPHGASNNDIYKLSEIEGMVDLNGTSPTVTVVDPDEVTIGVDTTLMPAYISGGKAEKIVGELGMLTLSKLDTTVTVAKTNPSLFMRVRRSGEPDYNAVINSNNRLSAGLVHGKTGASNQRKPHALRYSPYPVVNRDPNTPSSVAALPPSIESGMHDQRRWSGAEQRETPGVGLGHFMMTNTIQTSVNSTGTRENTETLILKVPPPTDPLESKYYVGPCNENTGGQATAFVALDLSDCMGGTPQEIVMYAIGNSPLAPHWMEPGSVMSESQTSTGPGIDMVPYEYFVTGTNWQNILNSIGYPGGPTNNTTTVNDPGPADGSPGVKWQFASWHWLGGEHEANSAIDAAHATNLLFAQEKADIRKKKKQFHLRTGQDPDAPTKPFFITPLGRSDTNDPERATLVREAALTVAQNDPETYLGYMLHDIPLDFAPEPDDPQHYSGKGYYEIHYRDVQMYAHHFVGAPDYANGATGPKITSVTAPVGGSSIFLDTTLDGGTKLVGYDLATEGPAGGPWQPGDPVGPGNANMEGMSGFRARGSVSKAEIAITNAKLSDGTGIELVRTGVNDAADMPEIYYGWGKINNANFPKVIRDDTRPGFKGSPAIPEIGQPELPARTCQFGCPLQTTNGWMVAV